MIKLLNRNSWIFREDNAGDDDNDVDDSDWNFGRQIYFSAAVTWRESNEKLKKNRRLIEVTKTQFFLLQGSFLRKGKKAERGNKSVACCSTFCEKEKKRQLSLLSFQIKQRQQRRRLELKKN